MKTALHIAAAFVVLAIPAAAMAGANKTWVSGTGKDTGTCPITAPCASFQYAVNQTAAGGEVDVKDAGGYGTFVITKSIAIVADGVLASISVPSGGTGIAVNAAANDVVTLKGLTINGHGVGQYGIKATQAAHLAIEDTTVQGMAGTGIAVDYISGVYSNMYLLLSRVTARNNNIGAEESGGENTETIIFDSTFSHNATGLIDGGENSTIDHCTFESNTSSGLVNNNSLLVLSNSRFSLNASDTFQNIYTTGNNLIRDFGYSGTFYNDALK